MSFLLLIMMHSKQAVQKTDLYICVCVYIEHLHTYCLKNSLKQCLTGGLWCWCLLRNVGQEFLEIAREHERRHEGGRGYAEENTAAHPSDHTWDYLYRSSQKPSSLCKQTQSDTEQETRVETKPLRTLWCFHCTFAEQK